MNILKIDITKLADTMPSSTTVVLADMRKQLQSSNLNILLGAGFSFGVYELLGNIEKELYDAEHVKKDKKKVLELKKKFFSGSILPYLDQEKKKTGFEERNRFFMLLNNIISNRQSSILHKIINVFTTNYDLLIEESLEACNLKYVDGFSGRIFPVFSTSNYGIIFNRQTSISSMTSEITTYNVHKVHGSLNWDHQDNQIVSIDPRTKILKIKDALDTKSFEKEYEKLAIINPTKEKLAATVMNVNYYDQLRMYCNELEKSNTLLVSFGFSFSDEHIQSMTLRSLQGNPTLTLAIFSYDDESTQDYVKIFKDCANVRIIQLVNSQEEKKTVPFTINRLNQLLEAIFNGTK